MAEYGNSKGTGHSFRDFLEIVRGFGRQEFLEVDSEVDPVYETTAVYRALSGRNPVIMFNRIKSFPDFRIVTNVLGSSARMALAAGQKDIGSMLANWHSIVGQDGIAFDGHVVENAPVKERVFSGKEVNILELPAPWHYAEDGSRTNHGRYITSGLAVTREKGSGVYNLSYSRVQLIDRNTYAFDVGSHGHFWKSVNDATGSGEGLEISVVIGAHPLFYMLAASFTDNEYAKASAILNTKFAEGVNNSLLVPADAEIVLEAELLPGEVYEEGPFAEYTGYLGMDSTRNVARVKTVMMRKDPIFYDIQPSNSSEHVNLFSIPRSSVIRNMLESSLPKGFNYRVEWPSYAARFLVLAQIENPKSGISNQLGLSLAALDPLWAKIVSVSKGKSGLTLLGALVNIAHSFANGKLSKVLIPENYIISSDPVIRESGTNDKIILLSDEYSGKVEETFEAGIRRLKLEDGEVVISHKPVGGATLNVIVPDEIDVSDEAQVGWAVATRTRPGEDIVIGPDGITILAGRKALLTPSIPESAQKRAKDMLGL